MQETTERPPQHAVVQAALVLLALAALAPFLNKAYHIDDPLFVWTAQRVVAHPIDFYGFDTNWYGHTQSMAEVNQNPPLVAYYLAPFGALFGWSERVMHLALLLPAMAALLALYRIARRVCGKPGVASMILLTSPAFLVSATSVMCDVMMLALFLWAYALWLEGTETGSHARLLAAVLLAALAALTKYFAIALIPLFGLTSLLAGPSRWRDALFLPIPIVILGLYELGTLQLYGRGLISDAIGYAQGYQTDHGVEYMDKTLSGIAFLGSAALPVLLLAGRSLGARAWAVLPGCLAFAIVVVALLRFSGWWPTSESAAQTWWLLLQFTFWLAAGLYVLCLTAADLFLWRDRFGVILACWIVGTLLFAWYLNHYINARVLLPLLPALGILCARSMERRECEHGVELRPPFLALAGALLLALLVAWADLKLANAGREAATSLGSPKAEGRVWFSGHWGFQYYMEARGARPIDQTQNTLAPMDTVVTPENTTNRIMIDTGGMAAGETLEIPVFPILSTMHATVGAGFYSDVWGPLPFVFAPTPPERYTVVVLP